MPDSQISDQHCKFREPINNFRIDFIDPLFAVAVHIGFVEGLLKESWLHDRNFPTHLGDWANLSLFVAAFWTLVASWVGYHKSIQTKPIIRGERFVVDILLLTLYILTLLYFRDPFALGVLMFAIYVLYIAWDFYKTKEYKDTYYGAQATETPGVMKYLGLCLGEWLKPGLHPNLQSVVVTFGWAVFFLFLVPFTLFPETRTEWGKIGFAATLIVANSIYRFDKRSSGVWIYSTPFKMFMAAMVGFVILYQTRVLCFGQ
jgi:hypothetical protein